MRKIIAALLLTCMLMFTAMAGDIPNPSSPATDGVIECPFDDGQMEFPLVLLLMWLL